MKNHEKNTKKLNWFAILSGHILERYEVMTFGFFIPILTPLFFPESNKYLMDIIAMSTFAAGYWARPIGGMIFGHIGDKHGRRIALLSSILCVTIPTFILGCMPTYSEIGMLAPFMLIFCRVSQGISVGGEYSGATVYFYEHSKSSNQGLFGGIMSSTAFLGGLLGTLVGCLTSYLFSSNWSWRLPFLIGGIASVVTFVVRKQLIETPVFNAIPIKKKYPFLSLFKSNRLTLLSAILVGAQGHILLYTVTMYFNSVILKNHQVSSSNIMILNSLILTTWIFLILMFGKIADKFSKKQILIYIFLGIIIFPLPLFYLLNQNFNFITLGLLECILSICGAGMYSVSASYLPSIFSPNERYSGVALAQTVGQALFGGSAPLIAACLSPYIGEIYAASILLISNAVLSVYFLFKHSAEALEEDKDQTLVPARVSS